MVQSCHQSWVLSPPDLVLTEFLAEFGRHLLYMDL